MPTIPHNNLVRDRIPQIIEAAGKSRKARRVCRKNIQPNIVKDELRLFVGTNPACREASDYLPEQRGKALDGSELEQNQIRRYHKNTADLFFTD